MATFEVEAGGKAYEVDAPDHNTALAAVQSHPTWAGAAKALGTGVAKGAIGLAGMLGDIPELGAQGIHAATQAIGKPFGIDVPDRPASPSPIGANAIQGYIEKLTGKFYQPQNTAEKYLHSVGEFAPGMVGGGMGAIARNAVKYVAIPGVAAEFAGQQTEGTPYEPFVRAAAGAGTGLAAAALSGPAAASGVLRSRMSEGVTPQVVADARTLMQEARARGVQLTWPEAIEQVSPGSGLPSLQRVVEGAPQSRPAMQQFYADRPQQIEQAGRGGVGVVSPPVANPSQIGPTAGRAAEETVNDVRQNINAVAEPYYTAAAADRVSPAEMGRIRRAPGWAEARDAVRNDPQLNRYVANLPDNSVGFLNEVKKYLNAASENASAPVNAQRNMQRSAGYGADATLVRDAGVNASPNYATALAIEQHGRERFLQPLLDGPIGRIASKDITTKNAIEALFPSNPLPGSAQEISTAVGALVQRNPGVASQLVRAHIESVFNEATQAIQSGANQAGGAKFWARLVGNPQQRENLRAAVEALPQGQARWESLERLMNIMEATGKRMAIGSNTSFNDLELAMTKGGGAVEGLVKTGSSPGRWLSLVNDKISQWRQGRNLTELARLMTDPGAGRVFERVASAPRDREALLLLGRVILQAGIAADPVVRQLLKITVHPEKPADEGGR